MRSVRFWLVIYVANIAAFAGVFRFIESGVAVPLVVFLFVAAACGACQTGLERALELRRKGGAP